MFQSLPHMLMASVAAYPERDAFRYRFGGRTIRISYRELGEQVRYLAHGLMAEGISPGTHIGILSENRPEWVIADFAAMALGCVVVPIHANLTPTQMRDHLRKADVQYLFISNRSHYEQIISVMKDLPDLKRIFCFDPIRAGRRSPTLFSRLIKLGEKHAGAHPGLFERCLKGLDPDQVCSIVFTSGTTGDPHGAMLHHKGFLSNIINAELAFRLTPDDVFLSHMPLSHVYERVAGHWCPLFRGAAIFYARAPETIIADLRLARPTVLVTTPRLLELIMKGAETRMETGRLSSRLLLKWGLDIGRRRVGKSETHHPSGWVRFQSALASGLVYRPFRNWLGGRLRHIISGGAPLSVHVFQFFRIMGIPVIEGYGLTETHPIVTLNPPDRPLPGSCGIPLSCCQLKIAEDGEVLVKGDLLMKGYYREPDVTRQVIDGDGWFHTGDLGSLSPAGHLYITDRKKDLIVTSDGRNISPTRLETAIRRSRYVSDVCVIGDGRPWPVALIIPDRKALSRWAKRKKLAFEQEDDLLHLEETEHLLTRELLRFQKQLPPDHRVGRFLLITDPVTVEGGELTPSLKLRRSVLVRQHRDAIQALYSATD